MVEIHRIKTQLIKIFQLEGLGVVKGIKIHRDRKNGKFWLSKHKSILMKFGMNIVKPIDIPLAFHCKL
jgi:hypothetical protein